MEIRAGRNSPERRSRARSQREQLAKLKWLGQVIVRAMIQPADAVLQQRHAPSASVWACVVPRAAALGTLQIRFGRESSVQNDEIVGADRRLIQRIISVHRHVTAYACSRSPLATIARCAPSSQQ